MMNNDVLRRVRYIGDFSDKTMMKIFSQADLEVTRTELSAWLKKDDDADFIKCNDTTLAIFLNGLINFKRGKKEGEQPKPETILTNNIIFRKLIIAFNLKSEDVIELLDPSGLKISKHELSALFRKPDHKHYRECKDQLLRNFLSGLQTKHRT